jgi:excisionase family DNA binding protein
MPSEASTPIILPPAHPIGRQKQTGVAVPERGSPLLPLVEDVDAIPADALPAFVLALAVLQARAAVRLTAEPPAALALVEPAREILIDADEAATRLGMSKDWLYRHARRLPFTRRMGSRSVRFSETGLERWLAHQRHR